MRTLHCLIIFRANIFGIPIILDSLPIDENLIESLWRTGKNADHIPDSRFPNLKILPVSEVLVISVTLPVLPVIIGMVLFLIFSAAGRKVIAVLVGDYTQERFISLINYILVIILIRQTKLVRLESGA